MSISVGTESLYNLTSNVTNSSSKTSKLKNSLAGDLTNSTEEELMEVCKSFESYLVEQVYKQMYDGIPKTEGKDNAYVDYFQDMMFTQYAEDATNVQGLGIAQMLFESMKRNQ